MPGYRVSENKNGTRVVYSSLKKIALDRDEYNICRENKEGVFLVPLIKSRHKIYYNTDRTIPLDKYIKENISVYEFYSVIVQILEVSKLVKKKQLSLHKLKFDLRMVFVKEIPGELIFLYEPLSDNIKTCVDVCTFLKKFVNEIKTEDSNLIEECRKFQCFVGSAFNYDIFEVENYIIKHYPQIYQEIKH